MNGTNSSATQKLCSHLARFWADYGQTGSSRALRSYGALVRARVWLDRRAAGKRH